MRTLLLGATGKIGSAVLDELTAHGHSVLALARSDRAARQLAQKGAKVLRGDLRDPAAWSSALHEVDGVIQAAATFTEDMGQVDRGVLEALIAQARTAARPLRLIYTGGCWLYGATGDTVATEDSPFDAIPAFAWMVENGERILQAPGFSASIIHPAMVYERDGGAFARFLSDARSGRPIEVWGALETRWPLVHKQDLARAYRLVLERGAPGQAYNVAAQEGVPVGRIVAAIARRFDLQSEPRVRPLAEVIAEQGDWAAGPALDQQMSAKKITTTLGWRPKKTDVFAELA